MGLYKIFICSYYHSFSFNRHLWVAFACLHPHPLFRIEKYVEENSFLLHPAFFFFFFGAFIFHSRYHNELINTLSNNDKLICLWSLVFVILGEWYRYFCDYLNYSWPLKSIGLNYMGLLICGYIFFFPITMYYMVWFVEAVDM